MATVSIVVPVYKAETFLTRCVDSILSQSFTDFELILVDDGSPDNSGKICDQYAIKDERIKVLHKANGGASSARNLGIENAVGEFLMFVDADDTIEKGYLENLLEHRSAQMVVGGFRRTGARNDIVECKEDRLINISSDLGEVWNVDPANFLYWYPWGKLFRLDVVMHNNICFNENLFYSEDFCFVMEYMSHIENFELVKAHDYIFKVENVARGLKYNMSAKQLMIHFEQHEKIFNSLGKKCNSSFEKVRSHIYKRLFNCFWTYLCVTKNKDHNFQIKNFFSWEYSKELMTYAFCNKWSKRRVVFTIVNLFPWLSNPIFKLIKKY